MLQCALNLHAIDLLLIMRSSIKSLPMASHICCKFQGSLGCQSHLDCSPTVLKDWFENSDLRIFMATQHVRDTYTKILVCRHVQVYPGGFSKYPDKIGIFLAGIQGKENQNPLQQKFRITIVNQHNHKDSVTAEFKQPTSSTGGTLKFW